MASDSGDLRPEAENRVRLRFDRQTATLNEWQREERERDLRFQIGAVQDSVINQAMLGQLKQKALAEHDKLWDQAKDRLSPKPVPAPAFDMMGGPPRRNLVADHDELRQRWTERREQIVNDYDQGIAACETSRAEMLRGFSRSNQARDESHREDRLDLAQRQERSFERLVNKELDRTRQWTSREFNRRSRDNDAREL